MALVLVAGGWWLLSWPADAPRPAAGGPAPTAAGAPWPPRMDTKAEAADIRLPAASTAALTPVAPPSSVPASAAALADDLRKVQLALEGRATPKEMLQAATILSACQGSDGAVKSTYALRDQQDPQWQLLEMRGGVSSDKVIALLQDLQRQCQAFDAATLARRGELLRGAYDGGAMDAALPYLLWLSGTGEQVNSELRSKLQREARQTVEGGDLMALAQYSVSFNPSTLGTTEVQRQAYREAWLRIQGEMFDAEVEKANRTSSDDLEKQMAQWGALPPPLSPEQEREADALAKQVVDAWRKRQGKGG